MIEKYKLNRGSKELGTFSYSEMKAAFEEKRFFSGDLVFDHRSNRWVSLEDWISMSEKGFRIAGVMLPIAIVIIFCLVVIIIKNIQGISE